MARRFSCSFTKVGTFSIVKTGTPNGNCPITNKVGGNVATYFCTPDGRVLHAIAGPVDADTFLREASWALALYDTLSFMKLGPEATRRYVASEHQQRAPKSARMLISWNAPPKGSVHTLLGTRPLAPLKEVYPLVWKTVVGEALSKAPVTVFEMGEIVLNRNNRRASQKPTRQLISGIKAP